MAKNNLSTKSFTLQLQSISSGIVWKNTTEANKYERMEYSEAVDYYIAACNGMLDFDNIQSFPFEILSDGFGFTDDAIIKYIDDKYEIPLGHRDAIVNRYRKTIIDNYVEMNDYYRMLNGLPSLEDIKNNNFVYNNKYEDVPKDIPVHELDDIDKRKLESYGYFDEILKKDSTKKYLKYIYKRKISPYHARTAERFAILFIDTNITGNILEDFKDEYRKCTDYMIRVHYTDGFRKNNEMYDNFIALAILFMTIQQMNKKYLECDITREFYDLESIKTVYESYGVPFYEEVPLNYHKKIIKKINRIIAYKGSNQVLFDLCDLFDNASMDIYGYYLVKSQKFDSHGNPVFVRNQDGSYKNNEMFDLTFVQVPIGDDAYIYISDESNHISYEEMISTDPYWINDGNLLDKVYNSEYNYIETKYLGIRLYFDLMNIMYEECYFFRMLFDNKDIMKKLTIIHGYVEQEVSLYDLAVYTAALLCKKNHFSGEIINKPEQIARVLGFGFKENLRGVIADINNNDLIDNKIAKILAGMNIDDLSDVRRVFNNIEELLNFINQKIYMTKDKETFYAYKKLRKIILTTKMTNETYQLSNGQIASSFKELLDDTCPVLYDRFSMDDLNVNSEIDYVINLLTKLADNLKYMDLINDLTLESVTQYLFKMINFFKSAKAELTDFNVVYMINSRSTELIKLFTDIPVSERHIIDLKSIIDLVYSDLINEVITVTNINSTLLIKDLFVLFKHNLSFKDIINLIHDETKWNHYRIKYDIIYFFDMLKDISDPIVFRDIITLLFEIYRFYHINVIKDEKLFLQMKLILENNEEVKRTLLDLFDIIDSEIHKPDKIKDIMNFDDKYIMDKYTIDLTNKIEDVINIYDKVKYELSRNITDEVLLYDYCKIVDNLSIKYFKDYIILLMDQYSFTHNYLVKDDLTLKDVFKEIEFTMTMSKELFILHDIINEEIHNNPIIVDKDFEKSYLIDKYSVFYTTTVEKLVVDIFDNITYNLKRKVNDKILLKDYLELLSNISIKKINNFLNLIQEVYYYRYMNILHSNLNLRDKIKECGIKMPYYRTLLDLYDDINYSNIENRFKNKTSLLSDKLLIISEAD